MDKLKTFALLAGLLALSPAAAGAQPTGACTAQVVPIAGFPYPALVIASAGVVAQDGTPITVEITKLTSESGYGGVGYTQRWVANADSTGHFQLIGSNLGGPGTYRVDYTILQGQYCLASPGWDCAEYEVTD